MKDREPTVRSRELGEGLRRAMEYAGYNGTQIADELGWSQGRVSRLLAGKRGGTGYDVSAFLAVCGVKGEQRDRLMALASDHNRPGWFVQHGPVVPKQVQTLVDHELRASTVSDFQTTLVHGLLQTSEYARETMSRSANLPQEEIADRIQARLARQELVSRPRAPMFTFFLHEDALRIPVGGPAIMSDQLHYLLRMSVRANVIIRVVPARAGAHAGMSGSFTLMEIRDFKPIVYLDSEISSLFLETPIEIDAYRNILASLDAMALDEGQSRVLISNIALDFGEEKNHVAKE
jgi:transcriptional regulator with XRE-family HTH domain